MGRIGAIITAVAVASGEDELLGDEGGEFTLERGRTEAGKTGEKK